VVLNVATYVPFNRLRQANGDSDARTFTDFVDFALKAVTIRSIVGSPGSRAYPAFLHEFDLNARFYMQNATGQECD
jgi:hypothetical protein